MFCSDNLFEWAILIATHAFVFGAISGFCLLQICSLVGKLSHKFRDTGGV